MADQRLPTDRARTQQRLERLIGAGAGAFYLDALEIISSTGLRARGHLVGHLMREIDSSILQAATPIVGPPPPRELAKSGSRRERATAIVKALGLPLEDPVVATWTSNRFDSAAHRDNLGPPRAFEPEVWVTYERFLDLVLDRVESEYDLITRRLDELLAGGPSRYARNLLCALPPGGRSAGLRYFFERAPIVWVAAVPACVLGSPAVSAFAARIAKQMPSAVGQLIVQIARRQPTEGYAHGDMALAAAVVPARLAVSWARIESAYLRDQATVTQFMPFRFVEVLEHLIDVGEPAVAADLLAALLALGDAQRNSRDLDMRMSNWDFQELLEGPVIRLIGAAPYTALVMLAPILAVGAHRAETTTRLSGMWLHAVADHSQDRHGTSLVDLARAVRDAAVETAMREGLDIALEALLVHRDSSNVFRRIGLHLIGLSRRPDLATTWLQDPASHHFDYARDAYELVYTLRRDFSAEQRALIVAALEAGQYNVGVQTEIRLALDPEGGSTKEFNRDVGLLFAVYSATGRASPFSAEQLNTRTVPEVVQLAREIDQDEGFDRAEIAPVVQAAVALDPQRYIDSSADLIHLPEQAMSMSLYGLSDAIKEKRLINWGPLLSTIADAVDAGGAWSGLGFENVRGAAASFLFTLAASAPTNIDAVDQDTAWRAIRGLADDPAPDVKLDQSADEDRLLQRMLSETRSRAVQAAIYMARWAAENANLAPAIWSFLAERAQPTTEPSTVVRSVYGWELPLLVALNQSWVVDLLDLLFPTSENLSPQRIAVWDAYIQSPHNSRFPTLGALRREWQRWADGLAAGTRPTDDRAAEILLVQYWYGAVTLDDPILVSLFANAAEPLRAEITNWLGWEIRISAEGTRDPSVDHRLQALWEWRRDSGEQKDDERSAFGQWFAGLATDEEWALVELERLVSSGVRFREMHEVIEALARRFPTYDQRVARIADQLVANEDEWERLSMAGQVIHDLVVAIEGSGSSEAAAAARHIRNRMVARGFAAFARDGLGGAPTGRPRGR